MIVKGRNRDTAWYAMLDGGWPDRKAAFERWLSPENFDTARQLRMLLGQGYRFKASEPLPSRLSQHKTQACPSDSSH
jgi:hypothetical protein